MSLEVIVIGSEWADSLQDVVPKTEVALRTAWTAIVLEALLYVCNFG